MLFGVVTVILVGVLVVRMFSANKAELTPEADQTTMTEKVGEVAVEVAEDGKKYPIELPEMVKVSAGENLWKIAAKYYGSGYNWVDIAKENNLGKHAGQLAVGQELKLPKVAVIVVEAPKTTIAEQTLAKIEGDSYTVVKGDNLWNICVRAYGDGYKWSEVAKANALAHPDSIEVGQVIKLSR